MIEQKRRNGKVADNEENRGHEASEGFSGPKGDGKEETRREVKGEGARKEESGGLRKCVRERALEGEMSV